ncbi:MAG: hypothetical protein V4692_00025, partial [Bdellovibrionota bacterium]
MNTNQVPRNSRPSFVNRALWTVATISATGAVALSGATHFGLLPGPQFELAVDTLPQEFILPPPVASE